MNFELAVLSWPGRQPAAITLDATCLEAKASLRDLVLEGHVVPTQRTDDELAIKAHDAVEADMCGPMAHATIKGDFVLSLWEWDAVLEASGQDKEIITGQSNEIPPGMPISAGRRVQALLYAEESTLEIILDASMLHVLFVAETSLKAAATLHLRNANGLITLGDRDIQVQDKDALLRGRIDATFAVADGQLNGTSQGGDSLQAGDATYRLQDQAAPIPASSTWVWVTAATLALVVAVAWHATHRGILPLRHDHTIRLRDYAHHHSERGHLRIASLLYTLGLRREEWTGEPEYFRAQTRLARAKRNQSRSLAYKALAGFTNAQVQLRGTQFEGELALGAAVAARLADQPRDYVNWLKTLQGVDPELARVAAAHGDIPDVAPKAWYLQS